MFCFAGDVDLRHHLVLKAKNEAIPRKSHDQAKLFAKQALRSGVILRSSPWETKAMQCYSNRKALLLLGLVLASVAHLAPCAFAGQVLPDRPGFGYTIQFTTGTAAEALLPVKRQALPDRPGFGYTINFSSGDPADSLYPPGWTERKGHITASRD